MSGLVHDLRHAVHSVARRPGTNSVVVFTLAVAIGVSTVIASVVDMVWHFVPATGVNRLVYVASTDLARGRDRSLVSMPDFVDWTEQNRTFEDLAAFSFATLTLTGREQPARVFAVRASVNLPSLWGFEPALGRTFRRDEARAGAEPVALLTHNLWEREYAGDPGVLGQTVRLDGQAHTIIGVLSRDVNVGIFRPVDVVLPLVLDVAGTPRDRRELYVTGALKPGVAREEGLADVTAIARQLESAYPATNAGIGVVVRPLIELLGEAAPFMLVLLGFILVLVLAIACANVSNVMLAHLMARQREFAIRAALGATRLRQVRQLLFEALVVSLVAGALGAVLASWGLSAIRLGMGSEIGQLSELAVNGRVLAAAALMAGLAPLGFALLPAFRVSGGYTEALRQGGRSGAQGSGSHRLLGLSVAGQVALTCVLCVEVGFLARAGWRLHVQEKGLNPANVLTLRLALPDTTYETPQEIWAFADQLLTRIGQLPGVRSAGAASRLPIADRELTVEFTLEGRPVPAPEERPWAARAAITPGYLPALGIPLVRGRHVGAMDTSETPPVVLVSQEAERRYWPNGDAIGKRIQFASSEIWTEIIGVVGDVRNSDAEGIDGGAITRTPQVYVPMAQSPERLMALMVRTDASDPVELAPAIREQVLRLDRNQPIFDVASMEQVLFEDLVGTYLLVTILGGVALVAMALAAAGISGVVGHAVVQRIPEIGIRMALGAQPGAMALMVVMQGLRAAAIGGVVGVGGSIALVSLTAGAIGDVNPNEPLIYVGTVGVLVTVATLAGYLPARRAARVDPLVALRYE